MGLLSIFRDKTKDNKISTAVPVEKTLYITGTNREYASLNDYDVVLKFWLPEALDQILSEMCNYADTTRSDIIRQTLFLYLYGRYDLFGMHEKDDLRFALTAPIKFSRTASSTPELGKNTEDVRVGIARKMKNDLQLLAEKKGIKLSQFIREILISNFLGHVYLPERDDVEDIKVEIDMAEY